MRPNFISRVTDKFIPCLLYTSEKNLPLLDGVEVDYAKQGLNEGFRFNNPNAKEMCGCGESFSV